MSRALRPTMLALSLLAAAIGAGASAGWAVAHVMNASGPQHEQPLCHDRACADGIVARLSANRGE